MRLTRRTTGASLRGGGSLHSLRSLTRSRSPSCASRVSSAPSSEATDYSAENVHVPAQTEEILEVEQYDPTYDGLDPEEIDELEHHVYNEGPNDTPYLLPLPPHAPSMEPVLLSELPFTPNPSSWNERFQQLMETPPVNAEGLTALAEQAEMLAAEFVTCVLDTVHTFAAELDTPESYRTLRVADLGGVAGGTKVLHDGIFYKFVNASNSRIFGDSVYAAKTYSAELRANSAILRARCPGISVPLSAVITFKGIKCFAAAEVPLHEGSLVYGSCDTGRRIRTQNRARHWMATLCAKLGLKLHPVRGVHGLTCRMYGPMDIEGHRSAIDGRFYVLDTARLFPCLSWSRAYRTSLRPELCASYTVPLNSDVFSRFANNADEDEEEVRAACLWAQNVGIPQAVERLGNGYTGKVADVLHERGICCHWLGRVSAVAGQAPHAVRIVQAELVARTFKTVLFRRLTRFYQSTGFSKSEEIPPTITQDNDFDNDSGGQKSAEGIALRYFRHLSTDPKFWRHLQKVMQVEFPDADAPPQQRLLDEPLVTRRVEELTGFHFERRAGGRQTATCTPVVKLIDLKSRFRGKVPDIEAQESAVLAVLAAREDMLGGMHPALVSTLRLIIAFYLNPAAFPASVGTPKALVFQRRLHHLLESLAIQHPAFDLQLPKNLRQHSGTWAASNRSLRLSDDSQPSPVYRRDTGLTTSAREDSPGSRPGTRDSARPIPVPPSPGRPGTTESARRGRETLSYNHAMKAKCERASPSSSSPVSRRPACPDDGAVWPRAYFDSAEQLSRLLTRVRKARECRTVIQNALFIAERLYGRTDARYVEVRERLGQANAQSRMCCVT